MLKISLPLFTIVAQCLQCTYCLYLPQVPHKEGISTIYYPRTDSVNLDDPAKQRWVRVMKKYREEIIPYYVEWQRILDSHVEIDQKAWSDALTTKTYQENPEYIEELQGIMEALDSKDVTWENLMIFQHMYEAGSPMACSEVLAAAEDGTVLHARNLDYRVISPMVEITFFKNGEPFMVAPTYLTSVGFHTALKHGSWSFGQNTRGEPGDSVETSLNYLAKTEAVPFTTLVRGLMEKDLDYEQVLAILQVKPLSRPMYFIMAGKEPYQGAVISRSADPKNNFHLRQLSAKNNEWFLFQANSDVNPSNRDLRTVSGIGSMQTLAQSNVNPRNIIDVMMRPPVYVQSNVVLFTMAPKAGRACSILGPPNDATLDDVLTVDEKICALEGWDAGRIGTGKQRATP